MKYRQTLHNLSNEREIIEPKIGEDGRKYVTSYGKSNNRHIFQPDNLN